MMAAVQPFISGAISKTVNMPNEATVEDIEQAYIERGGSGSRRRDLPRRLQAHASRSTRRRTRAAGRRGRRPSPRPLPHAGCPTSGRRSPTSSTIAGHEGYITVGLYEDGTARRDLPAMAKEGSTISGFDGRVRHGDQLALQYGVPLQALVDKFSHMRFEPAGFTKNPDIPFAKSIIDYIFRWLAVKFLSPEAQFRAGVNKREASTTPEQLVLDVQAVARARRARNGRTASGRRRAARRSRRSPRSRTRKTRRRARPAARSWCARARATSARTAARRAAARRDRVNHSG